MASKSYNIMEKHNLKTLSQVLNILRERGITQEIRMNEEKQFVLEGTNTKYNPDDLCIVKSYRFEGDSNPEDNAVLYVLQDKDGVLSIIIDSYGAETNYTGEEFDDFLRQIPVEEREEFNID